MWLSSVKKRLSQRCDDATLISRPMGRLHLRDSEGRGICYTWSYSYNLFLNTQVTPGACFTYKIQSPPCLPPPVPGPFPRVTALTTLMCVFPHDAYAVTCVCV